MGTSLLLLIWLVGAVVLGLLMMLTRGSKVVVEEHEE